MASVQLSTVLLPFLMIVAGAGDVMMLRIPSRLTILIASLSLLPMAIGSGMPLQLIGQHLLTGSLFLALGYGLFIFGFAGGGDAKLLAAAGLWFGFSSGLVFLAFTALSGGVLAVTVGAWFIINRELEGRGGKVFALVTGLKPSLPYGFAMACGAIMAMPTSWWMGGNGLTPS